MVNTTTADFILAAYDDTGHQPFTLTHFDGYEGYSADYHFQLTALSAEPLPRDVWLNQSLSVLLQQGGERRWFNGMIRAVQPQGHNHVGHHTQLTLAPAFCHLATIKDCRVYHQQSVVSIVKTVLRSYPGITYDLSQLGQSYAARDLVVQYNESYYDFIRRILAEQGIYYGFVHSETGHVLTLYDAKSPIPNTATPVGFSPQPNQVLATRWQQTAGEQRLSVRADTQHVAFRLGHIIEQGKTALNITGIGHHASAVLPQNHHSQQPSDVVDHYHNQLTLIEGAFSPKRLAAPVVEGVQPAAVTAPEGQPLYTDASGAIQCQMVWDRYSQHADHYSYWAPTMQFGSHAGVGSQFIPRPGDEVLLGYVDGCLTQPVSLGSVYPKLSPPLYPETNQVSGYHTTLLNQQPGHQMNFDDRLGQAEVAFNSAGQWHSMAKQTQQHTTHGQAHTTAHGHVAESMHTNQWQGQALTVQVGGSTLTIDQTGVSIKKAGQLQLKAKNVPGTYGALRLGDKHLCPQINPATLVPHAKGMVKQASPSTHIEGIPAARQGDPIHCTGGQANIRDGADGVHVDGKALAHHKSKSSHGGAIVTASKKVMVGKRQPVDVNALLAQANQAPLTLDDVAEIIYDVGQNAFYALTLEQYQDLLDTVNPLMTALDTLDETVNCPVDPKHSAALTQHQKAIVAAKAEVNKQMKGMANKPGDIKITELWHFIGHDPKQANGTRKYPWLNRKHTYVQSDKMKSHWRSYRLDHDFEHDSRVKKINEFYQKLQDKKTGQLSHQKLLKAAANAMRQAPTTIKMANFNAQASYKTFAGTVGNEHFNASGEATLFRATASGNATAGYDKKTGQLSFSANGSVEADLVNATGKFEAYIPSRLGYPISVQLPKTPDLNGEYQVINLGAVRVNFQSTVSGYVGATVAAGANLNLTVKQTADGKQAVKAMGSNKPSTTTVYQAKTTEKANVEKHGFKTDVNAFAGAKATGEVGLTIEWQNPDKAHDTKQQVETVTEGKPNSELNALQHTAVNDIDEDAWQSFGGLDIGGSVALGAGVSLGFSIGFNPQEGKFYIRAHAEAVCGFGLSGNLGFVIEAEHIVEFVGFVYHKIKDQNFSFVGLFEEAAFKPFIDMLTKYLFNEIQSLELIMEQGLYDITNWWRIFENKLNNTDILLSRAEQAASNIISQPEILRYTLPEVKGRFLQLFSQPHLQAKIQQQADAIIAEMDYGAMYRQADADNVAVAQAQQIQQAIIHILSYIQSQNDFDNVLQHMTYDGSKLNAQQVERRKHALYEALGFYGRYQARQDPHVNALVAELRNNSVYRNRAPVVNSPVAPNLGVVKYV